MSTRKRSLSMNVLIIGLFSLLAVGSWVGFDVYRAVVRTTVPPDVQAQILPLNPEIDEEVRENLAGRRQFDEAFLAGLTPLFLIEEPEGLEAIIVFPVEEGTTEETIVEESPAATESGSLSGNQATESGQVTP